MACKIDNLVAELNALNGKVYPNKGYIMFSDPIGLVIPPRRALWVIINDLGGINRSEFNGKRYKDTGDNLRREIDRIKMSIK